MSRMRGAGVGVLALEINSERKQLHAWLFERVAVLRMEP